MSFVGDDDNLGADLNLKFSESRPGGLSNPFEFAIRCGLGGVSPHRRINHACSQFGVETNDVCVACRKLQHSLTTATDE